MEEKMTEEQWNNVFKCFYLGCKNFWRNELNKDGFDEFFVEMKSTQNAIQDVANMKHNPFSPKGEEVPVRLLIQWLANK